MFWLYHFYQQQIFQETNEMSNPFDMWTHLILSFHSEQPEMDSGGGKLFIQKVSSSL